MNPNSILSRRGVSCAMLCLGLLLAARAPAQFPPKDGPKAKRPWMDRSLSPDKRAELVLEQMTMDEKISLVHGAGFPGLGSPADAEAAAVLARSNGGAGIVPGIARLGIPDLNMADSSVGVTRGALRGRYSTALPSNIALASGWDLTLAGEYGALIGRELRDQGYNVSLAGGVNIMREPRNGRSFEYTGEDPILAGRIVGRLMRELQAQHVIGDLKHFAVNAQETGRNVANVRLDKRSLREADLMAFEIALKDSDAGMVMAAYNRVNGDYCSENDYLLNDVLKKAWGFKGFVLSDWFGTHSTVKAARAGLDQEQPGGTYFGKALKKAIESGEVPKERLDDMVRRILRTQFACGIVDDPPVRRVVDVFGHLEVAQRVAEQTIVLLRNDRGLLPLDAGRVGSIAVIGSHADVGVLSGGGSAQVDPAGGNAVKQASPPPGAPFFVATTVYHRSSPLRAIRALAPRARVEFDAGQDPAAAAALAKKADVAIIFVNQPATEGVDARSLALPNRQDELVTAVAAANARTLVVLETGGPVTMPWIDHVPAVLEAWYPGIRGGEAIANVLFGTVNPSAKLPATFPKTEQDLPHPVLPGSDMKPEMRPFPGAPSGAPKIAQLPPFDIDYSEGLKVGYKWFDAENKQPLFAFGHGLSYTTFAYSDLKLGAGEVTFTLKNTGQRAGAEATQVYVGLPADAREPPKRLVAWEKVSLAPGETKTVTLTLDPRLLSVFNVEKDGWELVPGDYKVFVGGSSRETPLTDSIRFPGK
jgi:beta-glucosidase